MQKMLLKHNLQWLTQVDLHWGFLQVDLLHTHAYTICGLLAFYTAFTPSYEWSVKTTSRVF